MYDFVMEQKAFSVAEISVINVDNIKYSSAFNGNAEQ